MLDDFRRVGIAYSFGISGDVSWDRDMAERGYDIFMYDPTIANLPEERLEFHFFRKGIAGAASGEYDTLEHFIQQNHHEAVRHMILKMDVEGAEWDALLTCPEEVLQSFDQIVMEFHGMTFAKDAEKRLATLRKLARTHIPIHVHANNCGDEYIIDGRWYTEAWEVTYALRTGHSFVPGGALYTDLDAPNSLEYPEVCLFQAAEDSMPTNHA